MSIFNSKINSNIQYELEKRSKSVARELNYQDHLSRIPFAILQSNAINENGTASAKKYVLKGFYSQNTELINLGELGLRPKSGITSISIKDMSINGAIRRAVINFTVFDINEMKHYQGLYMNPGIYLFLQWGYNLDHINSISIFERGYDIDSLMMPISYNETTISKFNKLVYDYSGSYDCMVGVCSSFTWKLTNYGAFECSTTMMSPSAFTYGFRFNDPDAMQNLFYSWALGKSRATPEYQTNTIYKNSQNSAYSRDSTSINTFLVVGDSLSSEKNENKTWKSWPTLLSEQLNATYDNYAAVGATTSQVKEQLKSALSGNKKYDVVFIYAGVNDVDKTRAMSAAAIDASIKNLQDMINLCNEKGTVPYIIIGYNATPTLMRRSASVYGAFLQPNYLALQNAMKQRLSLTKGRIIPEATQIEERHMSSDGLHVGAGLGPDSARLLLVKHILQNL